MAITIIASGFIVVFILGYMLAGTGANLPSAEIAFYEYPLPPTEDALNLGVFPNPNLDDDTFQYLIQVVF